MAFITFATGCAYPDPKVMKYKGFDLILADQHTVDVNCQLPDSKWDNGGPIRWDEHSAGCYIPDEHAIYIINDCAGAQALPHELCHLDGKTKCDEYNWK